MVEFAFRAFATMVYALVIICTSLNEYVSLSEYYPYVVAFPVYSLLLCLIRSYILWTPKMLPPKKEEEAIEAAIILLSLTHSKGSIFLFEKLFPSPNQREYYRI